MVGKKNYFFVLIKIVYCNLNYKFETINLTIHIFITIINKYNLQNKI